MATTAVLPVAPVEISSGKAPAKGRGAKPNYLGTLYEIESELMALVDTEEMVPPEMLEEFQAALRAAGERSVKKLNSVYGFIRHLALNQLTLKEEITRLQRVKKSVENAEDRMRDLVRGVIEGLGADEEGKYKKLKCDYATFFVSAGKSYVEVDDPAKVPAQFKRIAIDLPLETWESLLAMLHCEDASFDDPGYRMEQQLLAAGEQAKIDIDEKSVKAAIEAGREVPGADLLMGEMTLVMR